MPAAFIALFAAAAAAAPEPPAPPPKVVSPVTVSPELPKKAPHSDATVTIAGDEDSPSSQQVLIWPASALMQRASGQVTLSCFVDERGLAERCQVVFETPRRMGFGDAALALRPHLRVTPHKGPDGQPVAGQMNIALSFRAPDTEIDAHMDAGMDARAAVVDVTHNPLPIKKVTLMTNPVWVEAPDFDAVAAAYPADGGPDGGYAIAHCGVMMNGHMTNCRVAKELPARKGFGLSAVKLAAQFRVLPEVMQRAPRGEPIEVDVPIRFDPPGTERAVNAPTWIQGFDPEAAIKVFPPDAAAKGLTTGRGVARCTVGSDGGMRDCKPDADEPAGLGFAQAAAKLASAMKMNLWSADFGPVEGGVVRVAIRLNLKPAS
jgi:TonB family protein